MPNKELPEDYALALQQIYEDDGDTIDDLLSAMRVDRSRLLHIIKALHHKGLITVEQAGAGMWLGVSSKGCQLVQYLWPESGLRYRY